MDLLLPATPVSVIFEDLEDNKQPSNIEMGNEPLLNRLVVDEGFVC
jgi:hypothetical protein